jgi:hypothetical protein
MGINFQKNIPAVVLPEGVMCPFNSQNTLFHHDALWGMLIPITTSFRVCDIWRGYWVQVSLCSLHSHDFLQMHGCHLYYHARLLVVLPTCGQAVSADKHAIHRIPQNSPLVGLAKHSVHTIRIVFYWKHLLKAGASSDSIARMQCASAFYGSGSNSQAARLIGV